MKKLPHLIIFLLLLSLTGTQACRQQGSGAQAAKPAEAGASKTSGLPTITIDGVTMAVEIVQDIEARQHGLMNREQLPENQGMLFVFETTQILSFWMRNTFIPLDIAFITEAGEIVDILRMEPLDESKSYISSKPALYALETNAGWFESNGVKVGGTVVF